MLGKKCTAMETESVSSERRTAIQTDFVSRDDLKMIIFQGADKIQKIYQEFRICFTDSKIIMAEIGLTDQFMMEVVKSTMIAKKSAIWVSLL